MRIAFVIDHYRPGKGGLEVWLAGITEFLTSAGDEVTFVTQETLPPRGRSRAARDRDFAERAREHTRAAGFDAVVGLRHCLSCDIYAPHGGSVAAGFDAHRRAKLLPSLPSAKVRNFLALERELLTGETPPRAILAVSEMVQRDLAERYPEARGRIRVVPNGVDLTRFSPDGRDDARRSLGVADRKVLLFLAGNPKLKGLRSVKEVFRLLRAENDQVILLTAGGDPGRLPAGGRYLGFLDDPEEALRAADVLLHPTWYDPFPLVVLEALACGTPVVTTELNGALDHLGRDGPIRAARDPDDTGKLADLTAELLATAPRADALRIAAGYPVTKSYRTTRDLIQEVAAR
jgi:UDP-glucose:(heptosyl)LPS alpha-1,3-glucosyltransferase